MVSTAVSSVPVTSWWYGQSRARDVARRLESLSGLSPSPGPAGVITARRDELTVTFVEGLKAPLPQPWQPAGREARIGWDAVDSANPPDPDHPVYLVVFGTTDDGGLVGLNLAAFPRIRVEGDPDTAAGLIRRWVLELVATHPAISIGVTNDVWQGPWTTRVQPVAPGHVPDVDVLMCGPGLTYAERAQIVSASTSPILIDLGHDAAVSTTWVISCGLEGLGQISRGSSSRPMTATLIVPSVEVVDRCAELLIDQPEQTGHAPSTPDAADAQLSHDTDAAERDDPGGFDDVDTHVPFPHEQAPSLAASDSVSAVGGVPAARDGDDSPIDFFEPQLPASPPPSPLSANHPRDGEAARGNEAAPRRHQTMSCTPPPRSTPKQRPSLRPARPVLSRR
ncbi:hypothetical protein BZL29_7816 [Mycobacterium kansasii]|uniref:Uncharacterized protein n=1 Tax=Mycobacterium kansasii TaxID=1768 RepID=A0A1V3WFJ1_MYCKA|nr:hypothetical protein BZL29_7816 [Mycobacterium kansasii]